MYKKIVLSMLYVTILISTVLTNACGMFDVSGIDQESADSLESVDWWTMFRHDLAHTGYSTSKAPDTNNIRWIRNLGGIGVKVRSSPAVVDGVVYVGSYDGYIYAIDGASGKIKKSTEKIGDFIYSSPAIADNMVFVGSSDGRVYALNKDTLEVAQKSVPLGGAIESSPTIAYDKVFIGCVNGSVYALNQQTLGIEWRNSTGGAVKSSPAVANGVVYIGSYDDYVYAFNATNGEIIRKFGTGGEIESSPTVVGGVLYVGCKDSRIYAFNVTDGSIVWDPVLTGGSIVSSPAIAGGVLYIGSNDCYLYAIDATNGAIIKKSPQKFGGHIRSSPAVADGKVFVGCLDKKFYALNATDLEIVWSYQTGGEIHSSPAVASELGGMVFVGSDDGNIYAFGPSNKPPVPIIKYSPEKQDISTEIQFDASISYDPDGSIVKYKWDFGDGSAEVEGNKVKHLYKTSGSYMVTLTVTDDFYSPQSNQTSIYLTISDAWPMFHHYSEHTGFSASNVPFKANKIWDYPTNGSVKSSPAVVGGIVYFGSGDGYVYALDATTSEQIWNYSIGEPVISSPAIFNGILYLGSETGYLYALNATTGEYCWSKGTEGRITAGPTVAYATVFVGSQDNKLYAFNATTLEPVWSPYATGGDIECQPAVADGTVFFGSWDKKIYALDAFTGTPKWSSPYQTYGPVRSSPAVAGGIVFVGSDDKNVYALNATTGEKIWNKTLGGPVRSSPAIAYGLVIVGANDGYIYGLNQTTGEIIWKYRTGGAVESSPAVAEAGGRGLIIVGSKDRKLYVLSKNGGLYWSYVTGSEIVSSPAIFNGTIFIGSNDGKLYAFKEIPDYTVHDVAVIYRIGYPESPYIFESYKTYVGNSTKFKVYIVVENQGTYVETFNVTLYVESEPEATRRVNQLAPGATITLTFVLNASEFPITPQPYQIWAEAEKVPEETDTSDNRFLDDYITITLPGDINGDFNVALADLVLLAKAYGFRPSDPNWNPNADIDDNGIVGLSDLVLLAKYYGQSAQTP